MLGHSLGRNCSVKRLKTYQTAAQTTVTSTEIDTSLYEGCLFIISMGEIDGSAATTCYVLEAAATGMGSSATLADSTHTIADSDDDKIFLIDVYRPKEPFLQVVVTRVTSNSAVEDIVGILYGARKPPVTHDSTTVADAIYLAGPADA